MTRKKHWTELENPTHEVRKARYLFLKEHERADQIVCSKEGIPLQAIYFSPEMPDYGKLYLDVPMPKSEVKDVK